MGKIKERHIKILADPDFEDLMEKIAVQYRIALKDKHINQIDTGALAGISVSSLNNILVRTKARKVTVSLEYMFIIAKTLGKRIEFRLEDE